MNRLILFFTILSITAFPFPHSQRIDSSSTTIPAAFDVGSVSKMANLTAIKTPQTLCVDNRSAVEVAVNCSTANSVLPTNTAYNIYVNASQGVCFDGPIIKGDCYIRSMGSAISSGVVVVTVISRE